MKICNRCKAEKEFSAFYPDPRYKDGYQSNCRSCKGWYAKEATRKKRGSLPRVCVHRSSRLPGDYWNRLEWKRLQRSLAKIVILSREEEIEMLIQEQLRDDRTIHVKYNPSYDENPDVYFSRKYGRIDS